MLNFLSSLYANYQSALHFEVFLLQNSKYLLEIWGENLNQMQILEFQLASGFYYEPCKIINKGLDRHRQTDW